MATFLLETVVDNPFPNLFHLLDASHILWLMAFFHLQKQQSHHSSLYFLSHIFSLMFLPPSFMYKDTCDYIASTWIISPFQDPLFNHICKVPFAMLGDLICRFHVLGYVLLNTFWGITVLTATSKVLILRCVFAVTIPSTWNTVLLFHVFTYLTPSCAYCFCSKNCVNEALFMYPIKNCSLYSCFCYHFWLCLFYFCPIAYLLYLLGGVAYFNQ